MANGNVEDTHHLLLTLFFIIQECNRLNVMIPRMQWVSYVTATYIHSAEIWLYLHYLNTIDCDEVFVRANCQDLGICCPLCFSRSRHWYSLILLILYHKPLQLWQFFKPLLSQLLQEGNNSQVKKYEFTNALNIYDKTSLSWCVVYVRKTKITDARYILFI